jgi:hypothetical protein
MHILSNMFMFNWLKTSKSTGNGKGRRSFAQTTLPLISPRRGRRILRREQLFSVVRESMIRGGVLSTSYEFKVLTLDANGDSFLVLVDLGLPAESMPDDYLLEIERWIQSSAQTRHEMAVQSVYWRRKAVHDQRGIALKAAVAAQIKRDQSDASATAIAAPDLRRTPSEKQRVQADEVEAFRRALQKAANPIHRPLPGDEAHLPVPESHSDFSALSETQYGKL